MEPFVRCPGEQLARAEFAMQVLVGKGAEIGERHMHVGRGAHDGSIICRVIQRDFSGKDLAVTARLFERCVGALGRAETCFGEF